MVSAVAISAVIVAPVFAQDNINPFADEKSGFYLGFGLGAADLGGAYEKSIDNTFDDFRRRGGVTGEIEAEYTERTGVGNIFGGYRINRYLAVEADYLRLGHTYADYKKSGIVFSEVENEISGYGLKAIGIYPINNQFELKASAGLLKWEVKEEIENRGFAKKKSTEKGSSLRVGLGANYNITDHFTVGLNWERINGIGDKKSDFGENDIDTYTASLQYNF